MKIIFLDIDGVLNGKKTRERTPNGYVFVSDELIKKLKRIIDKTGAEVVLSSSWRYGWIYKEERDAGLEISVAAKSFIEDFQYLKEKLENYGIKLIGKTPRLKAARGEEITKWLDQHKDVEGYVVLDDYSDIVGHYDHFVMTSALEGLTDVDVRDAIDILNGNLSCAVNGMSAREYIRRK